MEFIEDDDSTDISISNMADWMKFNPYQEALLKEATFDITIVVL